MKKYFIGNWKMYVEKPDAAKKFSLELKKRLRSFSNSEIVIAPPFVLIPTISSAFLKNKVVRTGAQTISPFGDQKQTGEISGQMLKSAGVSHVIVGHSERRALGENAETVRLQVERARGSGLTAILCVGEVERDAQGGHFGVIAEQLSSALSGTSVSKLIVAYEPVWAIGKSAAEAMQPADLQEMVIFIRKTLTGLFDRAQALKVPILYGGSVDGSNAKELMREGAVAGFLVGRASAEAQSFIEIIQACQK